MINCTVNDINTCLLYDKYIVYLCTLFKNNKNYLCFYLYSTYIIFTFISVFSLWFVTFFPF